MENRVELAETGNESQGRVISSFELTNKRIEQGRALVVSNLEFFRSQREPWRIKNLLRDRAYRAILEPPRKPISSQQLSDQVGRAYVGFDDKASPIINDNIEAIKARLKESILPTNKDYVELKSKRNPPQLMELRQEELNQQLEDNDIERKMDIVTHNAATFGTFFIGVPFVNDKSVVITRQLITEKQLILDVNGKPMADADGNPIVQEVATLKEISEIDQKYFGPGYEPVQDIEDVYLNMFIENLQDQPIVIRKFVVDWSHLMAGVEAGIYDGRAVQKAKDDFVTSARSVNDRSEQVLNTTGLYTFNNSTFNNTDAAPKEFKMYQAYCDFAVSNTDNQGNTFTETHKMVISIIGDNVIQMMPNPYFHQQIPLIQGVYKNLPGESYGMSAIDTVLDMYHEYNDTMNQINDSKILALNPIKIVAARSQTDKRDLSIYPGAEWSEKQPGDIRFAQFDFSTIANGLEYLELLELKINKGMGVTRLMQGMGDQSDLDQTKGGVYKVIAQADKKFKMIAKRMEYASIHEWAAMAYKVNAQFNPLPVGGSFIEINSETTIDVNGVANFFDNLEETEQLIQFTQQGAQIPGFNLIGFMLQIAKNMNIELDQEFGPMFSPPPPAVPEEKPMNVSVTMPVDMTKGTMPAMAAAQILAQKGIQLNLDAIGEAGAVITETTPEQIKQESGILPQERKTSVHTTRKSADSEKIRSVNFG